MSKKDKTKVPYKMLNHYSTYLKFKYIKLMKYLKKSIILIKQTILNNSQF